MRTVIVTLALVLAFAATANAATLNLRNDPLDPAACEVTTQGTEDRHSLLTLRFLGGAPSEVEWFVHRQNASPPHRPVVRQRPAFTGQKVFQVWGLLDGRAPGEWVVRAGTNVESSSKIITVCSGPTPPPMFNGFATVSGPPSFAMLTPIRTGACNVTLGEGEDPGSLTYITAQNPDHDEVEVGFALNGADDAHDAKYVLKQTIPAQTRYTIRNLFAGMTPGSYSMRVTERTGSSVTFAETNVAVCDGVEQPITNPVSPTSTPVAPPPATPPTPVAPVAPPLPPGTITTPADVKLGIVTPRNTRRGKTTTYRATLINRSARAVSVRVVSRTAGKQRVQTVRLRPGGRVVLKRQHRVSGGARFVGVRWTATVEGRTISRAARARVR